MVVDKEIKAKICSLIRELKERVTCLVGWWPSSNTGSSHHCRQKGRLAVVLFALAGWHSGQGSRVCNSTTISSVQEPCSTLAGVGHFGHRFSAFWLRSSVVSVLISLISDTLLIEQLIY